MIAYGPVCAQGGFPYPEDWGADAGVKPVLGSTQLLKIKSKINHKRH